VSWKSYASAVLAIVLIGSYASTILQQATLIALFGLLMIVIARVVQRRQFDWTTGLLVFLLIAISTITAVFLGLAFGLALFGTLVVSGVLRLRLLAIYSALGAVALILVMIPWLQIKDAEAPEGALDSLAIGAGMVNQIAENFSPEKEIYELIQTQAALINLGGEFPPTSGLGIANENRIFGAPVYSAENACGRFLTHIEPDGLWGPIETSYRERCVSPDVLSFVSLVNKFSHGLYPVTGIALLVILILSFGYRPHLRPIIIPAFLVITPYLFYDASISRYGALIVPLGCLLAVELIRPKNLLDTPSP
jgi:4-amino-4-deoxy-L-arabinose transferase-like glycosyltransferase